MAKIRLFYFAGRGRAEILRLILAAGNMDYDNVRFTIPEWPEYKKRNEYPSCRLWPVLIFMSNISSVSVGYVPAARV